MDAVSDWMWDLLLSIVRSLKVIVRWIYGSHEIERILYGAFNPEMPYRLENYINKSKQLHVIRSALKSPSLDVNTLYQRIVTLKALQNNSARHTQYTAPNLKRALKMIQSYNCVVRDMEESIIPFDTKNTEHQSQLSQLWRVLDPLTVYSSLRHPRQQFEFKCDDTDYERFQPSLVDNAWTFIGFQSAKPWSDFRAVGMLGLQQLVFFARTYPSQSKEILAYCMANGPLQCYSFAVTGLNITYDAVKYFRNRRAKLFYYKYVYPSNDEHTQTSKLDAVHWFYCSIFYRFQRVWKQKPPQNVMGYSDIHAKFIRQVENDLQNGTLNCLNVE